MPKSELKAKETVKRSTRELLLDVAEELFTDHGFDGTSVRDITEQAGTRLASINYHFGTKKSLFIAVIMRRAIVLCEERLVMLRDIDIDGIEASDALYQLIDAFVLPLLKHSTKGDPGWKNYCRLIAQTSTYRQAYEDNTVREVFDPPAYEFIKCLKKIMPKASDQQVQYAFQFMLGTTLYVFTENLRLDGMTEGKYRSGDMNNIYPSLLKYICGGILNLSITT
ncbi:MAG: TetR/AcrR family transcriptional regulator [Paraglaciecola sp.]|uniref:TetR/AcrR family transcriptional regulator n=1 Tax=Paraglaciecola sp. TaxID=1920173 RepID=UPI00329A1B64